MVSEDSSSQSNNTLHEFVTSNQFGSHNYDPYSNSLPLTIHSLSERMSRSIDIVQSDVGPDRHLIDLVGKSSNEASSHHHSQRLSLSLGSSFPCGGERNLASSIMSPNFFMAMKEGCEMGFDYDGNNGYAAPSPNQSWFGNGTGTGNQGFVAVLGNSKYLQPAQSLLQEMLTVGGEAIDRSNKKYAEKLGRKAPFRLSSKLKAELSGYESMACDKHGDYVHLLKLIALLEEVEGRYEEYSHHMEDLVHSFEAVAGFGAGKSYTGLAFLAMSKHFYRLRKAILAQIHATKQKLAKDMPKIGSGLSQLSLFDQEARQNRAILSNSVHAWRPLRGLPETSVTILRAWLFEHFLHPYPNDSEKLMLASQTGLSKNQVSNWFINARVRLWKPMIEEMYKEEFEEESDQLLATD